MTYRGDSASESATIAAYQVTAQMWGAAEQTRWLSLYNYLVASSILLLAWATVFDPADASPTRRAILAAFASAGAATGILWALLGERQSILTTGYADTGYKIERELGLGGHVVGADTTKRVGGVGPMSLLEQRRKAMASKWYLRLGRSTLVIRAIPLGFSAVFLVLLVASFS